MINGDKGDDTLTIEAGSGVINGRVTFEGGDGTDLLQFDGQIDRGGLSAVQNGSAEGTLIRGRDFQSILGLHIESSKEQFRNTLILDYFRSGLIDLSDWAMGLSGTNLLGSRLPVIDRSLGRLADGSMPMG